MRLLGPIRSFFKQYRSLHINGGYSVFPALFRTVQSAYYWLFREEEYAEMMKYDFIKFKHPDIYETMFTCKINAVLLPMVNDESRLDVLRKKHKLLERLGNIERRFLYVPDNTPEQVLDFLNSGSEKSYILKVDDSSHGKGMSLLKVDEKSFIQRDAKTGRELTIEKSDFPAFYRELSGNNILIEEYIHQHHEMAAFFPRCVNTVHIYTFLLPNGTAEIVGQPFVIFGLADSLISNGSNTVKVMIKPDGTLFPYGFSEGINIHPYPYIKKVDAHPDTGISFSGFKIPYWEEAKALVKQGAEKIKELRFMRWDIAVTETGPVVVESNGMPDSYTLDQTYSLEARGRGVKREYSEFLKSMAFSKRLTPEYIEKINRYLSVPEKHYAAGDYDAVIILGSSKCTLRTQAALDVFEKNNKIIYIVCGGTASVYPKDTQHPEKGMYTEAEYMKLYLMERNISEDRILMDNDSLNTKENLLNAAVLLKKCGAKNAVIVSSWFHGRRTMDMLPQIDGLDIPPENIRFVPTAGSLIKPDSWYNSFYGIKAIHHEIQNSELI